MKWEKPPDHQSFQHFKTDSVWERLKKWLLGEANIKPNLKFATRHLTKPAIFCSLMALTLSILVWKWSTIFSANQTAHAISFWTNEHDGQHTEKCVQGKIILQKHNDPKHSKTHIVSSLSTAYIYKQLLWYSKNHEQYFYVFLKESNIVFQQGCVKLINSKDI